MRFNFLTLFAALSGILFITSCASPEKSLEEKAAEIHAEVLTLDSHLDTPLMLGRDGFDIGERNDPHDGGGKLDFPRMEEGGLDAAIFAVFLGQGPLTEEGYERSHDRAMRIFDNIHQMLDDHHDVAELALTADDAHRLREEGKFAIYIGTENGYPIGEDL